MKTITSISRKTKGAAQHNREQVREIINNKLSLGNNKYVLTDKGCNLILVNTKDGLTGAIVDNGLGGFNINYYATGKNSKKNNGYVYTPIVIINTKGIKQTIEYGTHAIIAMIEHTEDFDELLELGKTPVVNHKNNCHWDNRAENLEWTTLGGNNRHGKIVASLEYNNMDCTHIEHNLSTKYFTVLNKQLSVHDIERYCDEIDNSEEFKVDNDEYIDEYTLCNFVNWLIDNGIW